MILKILEKLGRKKIVLDRVLRIQNFIRPNHGWKDIICYLEKDPNGFHLIS